MTNVKHCLIDQCAHVQIHCLTVNDMLKTVLNNLLFIECNKLVHNDVLRIHAAAGILF